MTLEQKIDICLRYIAELGGSVTPEFTKDCYEVWICIEQARNALKEESSEQGACNADLDDMIDDLLKELGVPSNNLGHRYLRHAIRLCEEDPTYIDHITKRLYPTVAKANNTTPSRAERAMRHSIELAFLKGDPDAQYKVFGNTIAYEGKPTNSMFISTCATEIKRRMRGAR